MNVADHRIRKKSSDFPEKMDNGSKSEKKLSKLKISINLYMEIEVDGSRDDEGNKAFSKRDYYYKDRVPARSKVSVCEVYTDGRKTISNSSNTLVSCSNDYRNSMSQLKISIVNIMKGKSSASLNDIKQDDRNCAKNVEPGITSDEIRKIADSYFLKEEVAPNQNDCEDNSYIADMFSTGTENFIAAKEISADEINNNSEKIVVENFKRDPKYTKSASKSCLYNFAMFCIVTSFSMQLVFMGFLNRFMEVKPQVRKSKDDNSEEDQEEEDKYDYCMKEAPRILHYDLETETLNSLSETEYYEKFYPAETTETRKPEEKPVNRNSVSRPLIVFAIMIKIILHFTLCMTELLMKEFGVLPTTNLKSILKKQSKEGDLDSESHPNFKTKKKVAFKKGMISSVRAYYCPDSKPSVYHGYEGELTEAEERYFENCDEYIDLGRDQKHLFPELFNPNHVINIRKRLRKKLKKKSRKDMRRWDKKQQEYAKHIKPFIKAANDALFGINKHKLYHNHK